MRNQDQIIKTKLMIMVESEFRKNSDKEIQRKQKKAGNEGRKNSYNKGAEIVR